MIELTIFFIGLFSYVTYISVNYIRAYREYTKPFKYRSIKELEEKARKYDKAVGVQ